MLRNAVRHFFKLKVWKWKFSGKTSGRHRPDVEDFSELFNHGNVEKHEGFFQLTHSGFYDIRVGFDSIVRATRAKVFKLKLKR